jgi:hypothetical protein
VAINCGLVRIAGDLSKHFGKGLDLALRFLAEESEYSETRLDDAARSCARHIVGQLAWNYVF